jgi:hypothetical protein
MAEIQRQNDDGSWSPAEGMGWQPGLDWEVSRSLSGGYLAVLYHRDRELTAIPGRWKPWLYARMTVAHWIWRRRLRDAS